MTVQEVNCWFFRYFSLWRFESGLIIRNIEIGGTGWGIKFRLVLKRTAEATPQSFGESVKAILSDFKSDLAATHWNFGEKEFLRNYPTSHRFQEAVGVEIQSPEEYLEVRAPIDLS